MEEKFTFSGVANTGIYRAQDGTVRGMWDGLEITAQEFVIRVAEARAMAAKATALELQVGEWKKRYSDMLTTADDLHRKNHGYRYALQAIAALPPSGDGGMMQAQNIADEAVAEKPKCADCTPEKDCMKYNACSCNCHKRIDEVPKAAPWNTLKTTANGVEVCISCGTEKARGLMCSKCFGPRH